MDGNMLVGLAAVIAALGTIITPIVAALLSRDTKAAIREVHAELVTGNGKTIGELATRAEGRRIETDVAPAERTAGEQTFVDELRSEPDG